MIATGIIDYVWDVHWPVYGYIYFESINNTYSKKKTQINMVYIKKLL